MTPSKQIALQLRAYYSKPRVQPFAARKTLAYPSAVRTMASNASTPPNTTSQSESSGEQHSQPSSHAPLPLPEPSSESTQLNVNGEGVKLDHLGPLVVNKDGTLSRIANWDKMAEIEKQNTLRILGKRNQLRLGTLRGEDAEKKE